MNWILPSPSVLFYVVYAIIDFRFLVMMVILVRNKELELSSTKRGLAA